MARESITAFSNWNGTPVASSSGQAAIMRGKTGRFTNFYVRGRRPGLEGFEPHLDSRRAGRLREAIRPGRQYRRPRAGPSCRRRRLALLGGNRLALLSGCALWRPVTVITDGDGGPPYPVC